MTWITAAIEQLPGRNRGEEVADFLKKNPDIHRFVILDDDSYWKFDEHYPEQFVYCDRIFDEEGYKKALSILTKK
jgi:hypothetical protein